MAVYACVLAALLPVLSLSLDEILDLMTARTADWHGFLTAVALNSGAAPLGYATQALAVHWPGLSAYSGRLPSALFSVVACVGIFFLARRLQLRWPLLAVVIFAVFPLQFRYALEARRYSQWLCLSIWSTVAFFGLLDRPRSIGRALLYGFSLTAGMYTLPFTLFVAVAHFAWACRISREPGKATLPYSSGLAILIAGLAFLPWYLYAAPVWRQGIESGNLKDAITWHAVPMILRELVGAGYIGSALVLLGFVYGLTKRSDWLLWMLYALLPIICAVAADAFFGYFLAIRQMIVVLAPLALLFTDGVEALPRRPAALLTAALLIALMVGNLNFYRRPREDWRTAAAILAAEPCVIYAPPDSRPLYTFFVPDLANRECAPGSVPRVALAVRPYAPKGRSAGREEDQLTGTGYMKRAELNPATPRVEIYVRP